MNQLSTERRAAVLRCLVEGNSIRATSRLTGASRTTVLSLLVDLGTVCHIYQDHVLRNIVAKQIQCDEIWSFVGAKRANVLRGAMGDGDVYTWTAMDADTKLMISWLVGRRSPASAREFIGDLYERLATRVQITTDGYGPYINAIERIFGWSGADFSMLVKHYARSARDNSEASRRYSPAVCIGTTKTWIMGNPDLDHCSTSYIELAEHDHADAHAALYSPDQCLLQKGRESRLRGGHSLHVLQLHSAPPDAHQGAPPALSHDTRDGGRHHGPGMDCGGSLWPA